MRHFKSMCLCGLFVVSICGSAAGQQSPVDRETNSTQINSLRWSVQNSRQVLQAQKDLNWSYGLQVKSLVSRLAEIDSGLEDLQEATAIGKDLGKPQQVPQSEFDNHTRISILGERALLEYKAQLLQTELENLAQGSGDTLDSLSRAMQKAEDLSEQIMSLRLFIREGRNRSTYWASGGAFQEKAPVDFSREATGPVRNDVQYVSDRQTTDPNFLIASAVVTNGKPGPGKAPASEPEAKATTSDLKKRMEEIVRQTKTLQQMIIEASQKAEMIKKVERQTYSKWADLEQLKKSWEGRKIPINEEFVAFEKKLNADLIMYQESLKEVEAFKQQLVSMFNGILYKESETTK